MSTIVRQIEDVEQKIKSCEDQLDVIDRSLRLKKISDSERENLAGEQKQLQEQIKEHETELGSLRKENRKNMFISIAILGLLYLVYLLFSWSMGSSGKPQEKTEL